MLILNAIKSFSLIDKINVAVLSSVIWSGSRRPTINNKLLATPLFSDGRLFNRTSGLTAKNTDKSENGINIKMRINIEKPVNDNSLKDSSLLKASAANFCPAEIKPRSE